MSQETTLQGRRTRAVTQALGGARPVGAVVLGGLFSLALAGCQDSKPVATTTASAETGAAVVETKPAAVVPPKAEAGTGPVVATYNGKNFTLGDYRAALGTLNARARKSLDESPDRRKQFIENHIISKLIYDEGVRRGLERSDLRRTE